MGGCVTQAWPSREGLFPSQANQSESLGFRLSYQDRGVLFPLGLNRVVECVLNPGGHLTIPWAEPL